MSPPKRIKPRPLVASSFLRATPSQAGGGRSREDLVELAHQASGRGVKIFAALSRLLDRRMRERAQLLYAWWCRCDAIAGDREYGAPPASEAAEESGRNAPDNAEAIDRVEGIRALTRRALEGQPTADPAFDGLGLLASECGLTGEMAEDVMDGFALDAAGWRPRTEADMMRYCYHAGGAVGMMMARVMNVEKDDHQMLDRACDLGLAFQLTLIARDLSEDNAAGRCYLPAEWLIEADIPPGQHMNPEYREQLLELVARILDMAESHTAAARAGSAELAMRPRWAVLAAANMCDALGRKLRRRRHRAWDRRVRVGPFGRLRHVARGALGALSGSSEPAVWPRWTRGELMIMARMNQPPAPIPMTPLPDEEEA